MPEGVDELSPRVAVGRWLVICAIVAVTVTIVAGSTSGTTPLVITYIAGAGWLLLTKPTTLGAWRPSWIGYLLLALALIAFPAATLVARNPTPNLWIVAIPVAFVSVTAALSLRGVRWDVWLPLGLLLLLFSVGLSVVAGLGWVDFDALGLRDHGSLLSPPVLLLSLTPLVLIGAALLVGRDSPNARRALLAGLVLAPTYLLEAGFFLPIVVLPFIILAIGVFGGSRVLVGVSILAVMPLFALALEYMTWPPDQEGVGFLAMNSGMALLSAGLIMSDSRLQRVLAQVGSVVCGAWLVRIMWMARGTETGLFGVFAVVLGPTLVTVPVWWGLVTKEGPLYRLVRRLRVARVAAS